MFGLPTAFVVATMIASYGVTGKSVSDNVASLVIQEDCALHYVITEQSYCKSFVEKEVKNHITITEKKELTPVEKELKAIKDFKTSIKW